MLISNKEVLMKRLERKVAQQQDDNRKLLKEVERMRMEIHKPQEATTSILQLRILSFDSAGSSKNHREIGSSAQNPLLSGMKLLKRGLI